MAARNPEGKVLPLRGRFSDMPNKILDQGIHPGSFDGILIDVAGCSAVQWAEPARGEFQHIQIKITPAKIEHQQSLDGTFPALVI